MKTKAISIILLVLFGFLSVIAQQDSIYHLVKKDRIFLKKSIIPFSLILAGSLISQSSFEKSFQRDVRNVVGNNFHFNVDDYTRYVPIIEMYAADAFGVKAKSHWFNQSKNLIIANMVSDFLTFKLKRWTHKRRPNDTDSFSFPSGHTSYAFTNASVLYHEFKDSSSFLAYSGYAFATTTGAFRIINNAHWVSDVLFSAGIGIIVTEFVYILNPIIKWNPFKNAKRMSFMPIIENDSYGFYLSKIF